ncbi:hypothetical protein BC962_2013 [Gillisia mitskevichiae]|uniref:Uncharacterized protein n=1 Tax=Gillisia mitskevichiae TaxID=270921 RepID=A0A495PY21_9FLAO|nr:hypothetical protein BC962_2013 [Gillisia mitskevichiae]
MTLNSYTLSKFNNSEYRVIEINSQTKVSSVDNHSIF